MPKIELKKSLSLFETTVYGVGIILGAGIYALIGEAAGIAGNAVWLGFVLAALIASFTALSYAELSSRFPRSAAEYVYTQRATGSRFLAFFVGWLTLLTGIIASAVVALGFGGYFNELFGAPVVGTAIALIAILSVINFLGIKESAKFNILFTLIEAAGLLIIIFIGLPFLGTVNYLELPNPAGNVFEFLSPISVAAALVFFAFIGFEDMANISEETRNASKTIPKALLVSLTVSTIIYILVSLAAVSVVPFTELAESPAPLALVAEKAAGMGWILSVIALFATTNTVLIMLIVGARMLYGMANEGSLPKTLARVHPKTRTPFISVFVFMFFAIAFALIGDIGGIAFLNDLGMFLIFFAVNVSLIVLRFKQKETPKDVFRSPLNIGWFPVPAFFGALFCVYMFFHFSEPIDFFGTVMPVYLFGLIAFSFGIPLAFVFSRKTRKNTNI